VEYYDLLTRLHPLSSYVFSESPHRNSRHIPKHRLEAATITRRKPTSPVLAEENQAPVC
jgi:hypothetical protein